MRLNPAPETVEEWRELPMMVEVVIDRACPHCGQAEFGAIDPFAKRLTYRCHLCGGLFRGRPGVDVQEDEA